MSFFVITNRKSPQRLTGCRDYGATNIIGGHPISASRDQMHVGINVICTHIFSEQNKSYASDRGMT